MFGCMQFSGVSNGSWCQGTDLPPLYRGRQDLSCCINGPTPRLRRCVVVRNNLPVHICPCIDPPATPDYGAVMRMRWLVAICLAPRPDGSAATTTPSGCFLSQLSSSHRRWCCHVQVKEHCCWLFHDNTAPLPDQYTGQRLTVAVSIATSSDFHLMRMA